MFDQFVRGGFIVIFSELSEAPVAREKGKGQKTNENSFTIPQLLSALKLKDEHDEFKKKIQPINTANRMKSKLPKISHFPSQDLSHLHLDDWHAERKVE